MQPVYTLSETMQTLLRREIYAVEGHRVINDFTSGWQCECKVFAPKVHCDHVRQALRLRTVRKAPTP
jgi:hypothetical protein